MKNSLIKLGICVALIAVLVVNCKKKEEDDNTPTLLLLYLNDQTSGNCAVINKGSATSTTYQAVLYPVPKGGCNASTLGAGTTKAAVVAYYKKLYEASKAKLKTIDKCSTIADNANSDSLANNATSSTTDESAALAQSLIQYSPVGSILIEGANAARSVGLTLGYTTSQIASFTPASTAEFQEGNAWNFVQAVYTNAYLTDATNASACLTNVTAASNAFKKGFVQLANTANHLDTDHTATKVLVNFCYYGTHTSINDTNRCVSLSTQF